MAEAGTDFGWLFPFKLWEHRVELRRKKPFIFWTSVALTLGIALFIAWAVVSRWL